MADWDVYWDSLNYVAIVTQSCNYIVYSGSATLLYEVGSASNTLTFSNGRVCTVVGAYEPNAQLERVGDNLYRDQRSGRYVRTQLCLHLALSDAALVFQDRVIFLEAGVGCGRAL